ncbi:MAG TPA: hypothetical protein VES67_06155 [Vicinamibacterales bacterium]|nr:hypothetical protein [Vicinamibacterales bacterium]
MTFVLFLAFSLVMVGTIGWFYGRQSVKEETQRRWGEKLRKEIEDAGGLEAWKRGKARGDVPAAPVRAALAKAVPVSGQEHPLDGSLLTARGVWTVIVLTDEDDGRTRRFALNLLGPNVPEAEAIPFIVSVPRTVIATERTQTWAADLRAELATWINTNAIDRREMTWWPNSSE